MVGRRRGRTGRGWDAAPPRPRATEAPPAAPAPGAGERADWLDDPGWPRDSDELGWPSDAIHEAGPPGFDGPGSDSAPGFDGALGSDGPGFDAAPAFDGRPGFDGAPGFDGDAFGTGRDGPARGGSGRAGNGRGSGRGGYGRGGSGRGRGPGQRDAPRPADEAPADPAERAREICLRLLSFRPRTRSELATALRGRSIPDEVIAEVLDRYSEVGMVDDQAFARAWVTSRHHGKGLARRALADELRRKGVDSESVGTALDELDPGTEAETARALVERKLRSDRGAPDAQFRRLVGMLARKGYAPGLAMRVVKDAMAEHAAALEEAGLDPDLVDPDALDS